MIPFKEVGSLRGTYDALVSYHTRLVLVRFAAAALHIVFLLVVVSREEHDVAAIAGIVLCAFFSLLDARTVALLRDLTKRGALLEADLGVDRGLFEVLSTPPDGKQRLVTHTNALRFLYLSTSLLFVALLLQGRQKTADHKANQRRDLLAPSRVAPATDSSQPEIGVPRAPTPNPQQATSSTLQSSTASNEPAVRQEPSVLQDESTSSTLITTTTTESPAVTSTLSPTSSTTPATLIEGPDTAPPSPPTTVSTESDVEPRDDGVAEHRPTEPQG